MAKKQADKPAEAVTPENVEEMTDDQVTEFMQGMQDGSPKDEIKADEAATAPEQPEKEPEKELKAEEAPEQDDPPEEDSDGGPDKAETVDFKRYDYERNRRRDAEKAREADRAEWQRRFDELLKTVQKPESNAAEKPAIPSEDEDPMATIKWLKEQIVASQQQREQETADQRQQREEWEAQQSALAEAGAEFNAAATADPKVKEAYDALVASFRTEAQLYRVPPHQMQQHLERTEMQHILYAKQQGISIADYVMGMAQARGWQSNPAPKQQDEPLKDNGATQRKARSLSNGGGSPGVSDSLSPQDLLDMDDKDFDALIAKHGSVASALAAQ